MKLSTGTAIFFAASIALAVAVPARTYYRPVSYDSDEYPDNSAVFASRQGYTLAEAPFFYQPRALENIYPSGRKYQIVRRKKKPNQGAPLPGSDEDDDDEVQDEEDEESSEEEADEEGGGQGGGDGGDDEEFDTPPWEELFPEEDKNTGTFNDGPGGGYGGQGGGYGGQGGGYGGQGGNSGGGLLANLPGGAKAPESSGSLMSLFTGGSSGSQEEGPQGDVGGPPQFRQGPPPPRPPKRKFKPSRGRTALATVAETEEPRTGGAVLYDGYNYIPVNPVHVRVPQRQAKTIKETDKKSKSSLVQPSSTTRQNKKLKTNKPQYVLVPVDDRDSREIRFSRDQHGFNVEHGPMYAPTEIWRWEGPGGRPLRRRENRPSGVFYTGRPQRGSNVRFSHDNDDY